MSRLQELAARDVLRVLGITSGAAADGVEAVLVELAAGSGRPLRWALRGFQQRPFPPEIEAELRELFESGRGRLADLVALEARLGREFAAAGLEALRHAGTAPGELDLVGCQGLTLWHAPPAVAGPERAGTWQAGCAAMLAELLGAPVVSDFQSRDVAAGGEGGPVTPRAEWLLLADEKVGRLALSLGGLSSLTHLPPDAAGEKVLAFHGGPCCALLDELVRALSEGRRSCDAGGRLAARGAVCRELIEELLSHPFLRRRPPRTTSRAEFGPAYAVTVLGKARRLGLAPEDVLATATELAARAVGEAVREFVLPAGPVDEVVVSGGGVANEALMAALRRALPPGAAVLPSDQFGLPARAKEAVCYAVLAAETVAGRAGNLPGATGAAHPVILGSIVP